MALRRSFTLCLIADERQSKGELEHSPGDISRRSQAVAVAVPEGWAAGDCSLRVLCCSAGGARAGFPDL